MKLRFFLTFLLSGFGLANTLTAGPEQLTSPVIKGAPDFSGITNASTVRSQFGLAIGTNVQAFDSDLTTWSGITPASGVGTFLATPSSANFLSALTTKTGTGVVVFGTSPDFTTSITIGGVAVPTISSSNTLTNKSISGGSNTITNISLTASVTGTLPVANGGTARTTQLPYTRLTTAASSFSLSVSNGYTYELITGLLATSGNMGAWASDQWTAPEAGLVLVWVATPYDSLNDHGAGDIAVFKNGSNAGRMVGLFHSAFSGAVTLSVAANDVLDFRASSNSDVGGNIYLNGAETSAGFIYLPNF